MVVKKNEIKENYELIQVSWFKTKKVTIKGDLVEIPIEWEKLLIGIFPTYDEALFILRKTQGNYRKNCGKNGIKPIAKYSIRRTGNPVTTRSVGNYLHSLSEANNG
tara:strand:+ start:963 stop:1280 length:318 start_codon:yes stop_codon:yes gene_type:complete